jgi:membrane protease YdiL (CAAX protease family)
MKRAWLELGLVVLTGAAHLLFENVLDQKTPFIAGAAMFWTVYILWRLFRPGQAREWGMRLDTWRPAAAAHLILFVAASAGMVGYGISQGRPYPTIGFFYLLWLYPIWGFIQQFLLCALVCRNLREATGRAWAAVVGSSLLFGIAHAPDWTLCALTAAAGVAWTALYLRWPNLWIQAIAHGWLGALAYYYVLGRDPWSELMRTL